MKLIVNFLAVITLIALFSGCGPKETVFYVSVSGNDSWSGMKAEPGKDKSDGPFATLEKAREAVRNLKKSGKIPDGGIKVYIRGGAYPLSASFTLTADDSGTKEATVEWSSYNGETVQIVGGKEIKDFKAVADSSIIARLDEKAKANVLVADLKAQGITDYGEITQRGGPGLELFFQDKRMQLSRWPNEGWTKIVDVPQSGKLVFKGDLPHKRFDIPVGKNYGRFVYDGDRPSKWLKPDEVFLHGYWTWDWYDEFLKIDKIDSAKKEIWIKEPHSQYGYCKEQRYYALNILEELDMPGEWFIDRPKGLLYFWPPAPVTDSKAFVSLLNEPLAVLDSTQYITIKGINFEFTRGTGVVVKGGENNLIAGCTIRNLGGNAVQIEGGTNNGITGCDIYDIAGAGVSISGGDRKTLNPGGNFVTNNHIHNYSEWVRTYQGAVIVNGVGNRVANNLIHDAPHTGILLGGNENIVEYNELHTLAQQTGDVGAFYMGRDWTQRGNIIRYNYFHDLLGPGLYGVMAVYLDDWSSGTTIFGNVFYKSGRSAFIGGGRDNTVENNIFIECAPSVHVDARGLGWASYYFDKKSPFYVNTMFDRMDDMKFSEPPYSEKYPELLKLYNDEPAAPKNNKILRNVSYGGTFANISDGMDFKIIEFKDNLIADPVICTWQKKLGGEESEFKNGDPEITKNLEGNTIINGDPGFVDLANKNFQLKDDSQAYKLGFKKIPMEKIGLYIDEYRKALPEKSTVKK